MALACPPRGVYVPIVAFFKEDESLDIEALTQHITRIVKSGVAGLVIQGSNGEAPHLLQSERQEVIATAAAILKEHGKAGAVIIAGCGAQSTRETVLLCNQAKESGADYALVLSPSYWTGAMQKPTIQKFFNDVADVSPIPILIYNFPAVVSGIDLDSDTIAILGSTHANIVGVKLSCANVGKCHRITHDSRITSPFATFAGKSDIFLHGLVAGSHGIIAATANLVPKAHVRLLKLYDEGKLKEAQDIQTLLSDADWAIQQLGVAGLKGALGFYYGYGGGRSRRPLGVVANEKFVGRTDKVLKSVIDLESSL